MRTERLNAVRRSNEYFLYRRLAVTAPVRRNGDFKLFLGQRKGDKNGFAVNPRQRLSAENEFFYGNIHGRKYTKNYLNR